MDLKLKDKTALITGSTAGIGLATAERLLSEGAHVIINGRTQGRVDQAIQILQKSIPSGKISGIAADLSTPAGFESLAKRKFHVDILVNNLGAYESKSFQDSTDEDWARMINTNLMSGVRLSRLFIGSMRKQDWGRIVFVASETAVNIPADMISYGVSKAAQVALSRGLAETTVGTNITVNSVLPGPTKSEGIAAFLKEALAQQTTPVEQAEKEFLKKLRPTSLIQRFAEPEEVASLIAYLASPLSSATNGAALRVDGGLLRGVL